MILCSCFAVTETDIEAEISAGARTEDQIGQACGAGTDCGDCLDIICHMLARPNPDSQRPSPAIA
jgi:bacterioferritin-associated ferredoxin